MKTGYWLPDYRNFLKKLIQARKEANFTQTEAAQKLNKPQSFISKCEKGERRVDALELQKFAKLYKQNLYYFFHEAKTKHSEQNLDFSIVTQKAHEVFYKYDNNELPINIEQIASTYGIALQYKNLKKNISAILYFDESPRIIVNKNDHVNRQRFSIAHEMGHLFLEHGLQKHTYEQTIFFRAKENKNQNQILELEANHFAAELLMPSFLLKKRLNEKEYKKLDDKDLISKLATEFQVSTIAMQIRLQKYFEI